MTNLDSSNVRPTSQLPGCDTVAGMNSTDSSNGATISSGSHNGQPKQRTTGTGRIGLSSFPNRLVVELAQFNKLVTSIRESVQPAANFEAKCQQAFDIANDLFGSSPNWVCFYREMLGGRGMVQELFPDDAEFGRFLRSEQYHQIQLMLTALRSRDLPENDPNDPQRMITVRLPKSLHEAMCEEAGRLNISVNRLCISRMLQLLDPRMIPETQSKPRGRKPRLGNPQTAASQQLQKPSLTSQYGVNQGSAQNA